MRAGEIGEFRKMCRDAGMAATHQRLVVWQALKGMHGHPSPEQVYARVKTRIPAISLATVYKNIHFLIDAGVFREVSPHHGSMRVETNPAPHHHLVCRKCRSITDLDASELRVARERRRFAGGFLVEGYTVDVLGVCAQCQKND